MKSAIVSEIPVFKEDERGTIFDCEKVRIISRKKGSISADHKHQEPEILFLVSGKIELEVDGEKELVKGYKRIEIAGNAHHLVKALTDIIMIEDREMT